MTASSISVGCSARVRVRRARSKQAYLVGLLFLAPALIFYLAVVIYPIVYSGYLSFFRWNGVAPRMVFVGLRNYTVLLTYNPVFWTALRNNAIWVVCALIVPNGIGLVLALVLNTALRGRAVFRSIFYFPSTLSLAVVGLIWTWIYHPQLGLLNQVLDSLGLHALTLFWLSDPRIALLSVIAAASWAAAGLPMLLYLAGLQTIPPELLEAAALEGATRLQVIRHVTLPLLRETTLIVVAITTINSLKVYDIIFAMTYGGPANKTQVLGTLMYFLTYTENNVGAGTAVAMILLLLTLCLAIPYVRHLSRETA
jgi:raffinose/stachyose/melibiose transport system permease protein